MKKRFGVAALVGIILVACGLSAWFWRVERQEKSDPGIVAQVRRKPGPAPKPQPTGKPASAAERQAAIRSILGQLNAFRRDDYKTAIGYQSKLLKGNFPSLQVFRNMIRQSYPQFARYKTATFGAAIMQHAGKNPTLVIPIVLTGQDGIKVEATYQMTKENGVYRVSGVNGGSAPTTVDPDETPKIAPAFEEVAPLIT